MRSIRFENVTKRFHGETIIESLNLTIPGGQFFALLGPSGSGKTTLLRLIAGFETVDSGKIFLDDRDITHVPINERPINTVFQQYALFPHLNVFENVAYGLKVKHVPQDEIEYRVTKVLEAIGLEKYRNKAIGQLSGGQQQRVTLARAIVNEPQVLLLDEPLAALDVKMREKMLVELMELQVKLKTTFVYVTHDQLEALTVADHMAIMNYDGEIEQLGNPQDVYEFPVSSYVATFVGSSNIIKGTISKSTTGDTLQVAGWQGLPIIIPERSTTWAQEGKEVLLSIRPEKIDISKSPLEGFSNYIPGGVVDAVIYHGQSTQYRVRWPNGQVLLVFEQNEEHFLTEEIEQNDTVHIYWQKENTVLLEK